MWNMLDLFIHFVAVNLHRCYPWASHVQQFWVGSEKNLPDVDILVPENVRVPTSTSWFPMFLGPRAPCVQMPLLRMPQLSGDFDDVRLMRPVLKIPVKGGIPDVAGWWFGGHFWHFPIYWVANHPN